MQLLHSATPSYGGAFSAEKLRVSFSNNVSALLLQNIQGQWSKAISRLYDLSAPDFYYSEGRTEGQASLQRVVGASSAVEALYSTFTDACNADKNHLKLDMDAGACFKGGGGSGGSSYTLQFCILNQIGLGASVEQGLVQEQSSLMFSGCVYNGSNGAGGRAPVIV